MANVRCQEGHEYDTSKYTNCPWCKVRGLKDKPGGIKADEMRSSTGSTASESTPKVDNTASGASRQAEWTASTHPTTKVSWKRRAATASVPPSPTQQGEKPAVGDDPVVGWLVAYHGPLLGADFRIRCGNNSIGRDLSNHISLGHTDQQIHGLRHAFIDYDPESNTYAVKPGDQQQHVYIRDEQSYGSDKAKWLPVRSPIELKPWDEIKIGASIFVFVPLCGGAFRWELED